MHAAGPGRDLGQGRVGRPDGEQRGPAAGRLGREGERPGGPTGLRDGDDEVEGPDPAGQGGVAAGGDGDRRAGLGEQVEDVTDDRRPPEGGNEDRPRPLSAGDPVDPRLLGRDDGPADLGTGRCQRAQRVAGVEGGEGGRVVQPPLVDPGHRGAPGQAGRRASSTRSTGTPSSTR